MAVYYVDADELDGIAIATSNARNDLWWTIKPIDAVAWGVPWPGDTRGQWERARHIIDFELGWLDNDARALRDRAGRVRVEAAQRAVFDWVVQSLAETGSRLSSLFSWSATIDRTAIQVFDRGFDVVQSVYDFHDEVRGFAKNTLNIGHAALRSAGTLSQYHDLAHAVLHAPTKLTWALQVIDSSLTNWGDYGADSIGTFLAGTALDTALTVGLGWGLKVVAVTAVLGAFAILAPATPAIVVGGVVLVVGLGALMVADRAIDWVRTTPPYQAGVRTAGKVIDGGIDVIGDVASGAVRSGQETIRKVDEVLDEGHKRLTDSISGFEKSLDKLDLNPF